jgi:hypothetical protein
MTVGPRLAGVELVVRDSGGGSDSSASRIHEMQATK